MSLAAAIESGKEHRKPYRGAKAFDYSCHNHGSCSYCRDNRLHNNWSRRAAAEQDMREFWTEQELSRALFNEALEKLDEESKRS